MPAASTTMPAAPLPEVDDAVDASALVRDARLRAQGLRHADRWSGLIVGGSFLATVGTWLMLAPPAIVPWPALLGFMVAHAVASSVEFEFGPGSALPTTPVLVVALFTLPAPVVPLVPLGGLVGASLVARLRDPGRRERFLVLAGSAWHAVGPAAVFAVAGVTGPSLGILGIFVVALGAQFACDAAASWIRNSWGLGVPTATLANALRFTFLVDLLLAPIGLAAALADPGSAWALAFLIPPTLLLAVLQADRRLQISRTVALGEAVTEAAEKARRDPLTRLRNRLAWEEMLARHAADATPIAIILADVDGLKRANDAHGHDVGDALLRTVADCVARSVPPDAEGLAARLGGDEFGILLAGRSAGLADPVASRLRELLRTASPVVGIVPVSASVGVGLALDGARIPAAMLEADRGVYDAKAGRGRT